MFVVRNLGASIAKNVLLTFDPRPPDNLSQLPNDNMLKWIYERYAAQITTWPPGWTLSNVIRTGQDPLSPITVTVTYEGPDGTRYQDPYYLHPDHILKETSSTPAKANDATKLEQQKVAALQALVRTIRSN
jgi:hypothetical protein